MAGNAIEKTHNNPNAMHSQKPMQITHNNPSHPPKHPDGEQSGNFIEKHDHKKESVEIQGKVELSQAEIPGN